MADPARWAKSLWTHAATSRGRGLPYVLEHPPETAFALNQVRHHPLQRIGRTANTETSGYARKPLTRFWSGTIRAPSCAQVVFPDTSGSRPRRRQSIRPKTAASSARSIPSMWSTTAALAASGSRPT